MDLRFLIQNPVGTHFSDTELQDYGIEGYTDNIDDEGRPIFAPINIIDEGQCRQELRRELIRTGSNFGIDDYIKCVEIISSHTL